jgi:hypothetical protein
MPFVVNPLKFLNIQKTTMKRTITTELIGYALILAMMASILSMIILNQN